MDIFGEHIMKKRDVVNLIKYAMEHNMAAFKDQAYEIAADFQRNGDENLGYYILSLISDKSTLVAQDINIQSEFLHKVASEVRSLPLPDQIVDDLTGIVHAVGYHAGINKFLFSGAPGTGKTESAKHLARMLGRDLYCVDFESIIDSRLGQTSKNIAALFNDINNLPFPDQIVILFDELDALAMERTNQRDVREMGRATSSMLKGLDSLNEQIVLVGTTNLAASFDKALLRRFDKIVDFNRYSQEDLLDIALVILEEMLDKCKIAERNIKLFKKMMGFLSPIPYPGDLRNMIRSAIAFSDPTDPKDYLRRLWNMINPNIGQNLEKLKQLGFTVREIEILANISKSKVSRSLTKGDANE